MKRGFPGEALKNDGAQAPEVGLGVVLERHDDLRGLGRETRESQTFS